MRELRRALDARDIHYADEDGTLALHLAAHLGDVEAVRELLDLGADPNARMRNSTRPIDLTTSEAVAALLRDHGVRGQATDARSAAWARFGVTIPEGLVERGGRSHDGVDWLAATDWYRDADRRVVFAVREDGTTWALDLDGQVWQRKGTQAEIVAPTTGGWEPS